MIVTRNRNTVSVCLLPLGSPGNKLNQTQSGPLRPLRPTLNQAGLRKLGFLAICLVFWEICCNLQCHKELLISIYLANWRSENKVNKLGKWNKRERLGLRVKRPGLNPSSVWPWQVYTFSWISKEGINSCQTTSQGNLEIRIDMDNASETDWSARKYARRAEFFLTLSSNSEIIIISCMCIEILTFLFIALSPQSLAWMWSVRIII